MRAARAAASAAAADAAAAREEAKEAAADAARARAGRVVAVPGLVPDEVFFRHLANRTFVAGRFIRKPEESDYLEEPDVFHDVFGHVPLLADPQFADFYRSMQAYEKTMESGDTTVVLSSDSGFLKYFKSGPGK